MSTTAPRKAAKNPWILNPGTKALANSKMIALITRKNRPRVKIPSGNVRSLSRNPKVAFRKPTTREAINALPKLAISKPGTRRETIISASALNSHINNN